MGMIDDLGLLYDSINSLFRITFWAGLEPPACEGRPARTSAGPPAQVQTCLYEM